MKYGNRHSLVVGKRIFDHEIGTLHTYSLLTRVCITPLDKKSRYKNILNDQKQDWLMILQIRETPFINADMKADIIDGTRRWPRLDLYHNDDVRLMD
ncbi:unnamed protein product [Rhizophagus irregularis]|nr:unnamed protein product [Rhizophagus irregularis]